MSDVTPAERLLHVVQPLPWSSASAPTDGVVQTAIDNFVSQLVALEEKYAKKPVSDKYLIGQVFGHQRVPKNDIERQVHCRNHLRVAVREFKKLIKHWLDPDTKTVTLALIAPWKDIVTDFIFDLNEIIPFLERKKADFVYLRGDKNPGVHSWEVYLLSRGLAVQSTHRRASPPFDHKAAQIAAIFVLRQSMELRFERLIGVYPEDKNWRGPRLKHGFHQDFLASHPQYFKCDFVIEDLRPVYDWCSEIVHLGYQPFAWQTFWSLDLCGALLGTRSVPRGEHWNIANAIEIIDVRTMQASFENFFLQNYDHGSWRMTRTRPEALVKDWVNSMAFTAADFRSVSKPVVSRGWLAAILAWLRARLTK